MANDTDRQGPERAPPADDDESAGDDEPTSGDEPTDDEESQTGADHVVRALEEAGISLVVGIPGTQTLPLDRAIGDRDGVEYLMARHETAVPHVAWGYYEARGSPAATVTVPGPGETNAMHGLKNAADDSVPLVHVSADANPEDRGKGPIHELDPSTFDSVVKGNFSVERPLELPSAVASAVELARTPPYGPVRMGVPKAVLDAPVRSPAASVSPARTTYDNEDAYARAADRLASADRPALVVGGGCRRASDGPNAARELASALDAPVVVTLKGKGAFPEDDPRFLGAAGSHLPAGARTALRRADVVLALGTDFDGVTTDGWSLPTGESLIHVTLDPDDVDRAYDAEVAILDDAGVAAERLREAVEDRRNGGNAGAEESDTTAWSGEAVGRRVREEYDRHLRRQESSNSNSGVTSPTLLRALRGEIPREAVVTTDIGGFRLWTMQAFEAYDPERFVTAGSWAGMGVGLPAAIGAKLARPDAPVVALTGDGGLLMCIHELGTAAERGLDIVVVVCNNADYGVISNAPERGERRDERRFDWESPAFAAIAEGFGWEGVRVDTVEDARDAVADALDADGPVLVDVAVDPREPTAKEAADYETALETELSSEEN